MESTDKESCLELAALLRDHGVKHVVMSPGSRNVPLMMAIMSEKELSTTVIVDERCAAFYALGQSLADGLGPVAVVSTSGSAVLNLAPAVSEAYYRGVPLIVVTADRPAEWIDQDDSQTIHQAEALSSIVKRTVNLAPQASLWQINRDINDALLEAVCPKPGPVHINVQLAEPLSSSKQYIKRHPRLINALNCCSTVEPQHIEELTRELSRRNGLMIVAGFMHATSRLKSAVAQLAAMQGVVVVAESTSNLQNVKGVISRVETAMTAVTTPPEAVITIGGGLISRRLKEYIRHSGVKDHWHIGHSHITADCYKALTLKIEADPENVLTMIADQLDRSDSAGQPAGVSWKNNWISNVDRHIVSHDRFIATAPWSDLRAMAVIMSLIPEDWDIQFSNGTSVRYSLMVDCSRVAGQIDCNRGVSGIDGSTSTAIGSASVARRTTLLVTGDMSAQYDIGALFSTDLPSSFKMIVLMNGGGQIFRTIESTARMKNRAEVFEKCTRLPLREIAGAAGMDWHEAANEDELRSAWRAFSRPSDRASVLAIITDGATDAKMISELIATK